jgi:hypothetical protein
LIDKPMITGAAPGKIVIHQSPENKKSSPTGNSAPGDDSATGTPAPGAVHPGNDLTGQLR